MEMRNADSLLHMDRHPIAPWILGRFSHCAGELMSGRASLGGFSTDAAASRGIYAPRDSILLPSDAIRAPLKSTQIRETASYIAHLLALYLFLTVTGLSIVAALFILLFVET